MKLKQYIDTHPVPVLVSVVLATAAVSSGVVTSTVGTKYEAAQIKLEAEYKSDLSGLKTRLASIERKLGADERTYFDVSQLVVTPDRIKSLDQSYRAASDGLFYYVQPLGKPWKYELVSEGELATRKVNADGNEFLTKLAATLGEKNVHLWRSDQVFTVNPKAKAGSPIKALSFFPMVALQALDEAQFKHVVGGVGRLLSDETDDLQSKISELTGKIDHLQEKLTQVATPTGGVPGPAPTRAGPESSPAQMTNSVEAREGDDKIELESYLGNMFRGDLAAVVLGAIIQQTLQLSQAFEGAEGSIRSVQKKGNVLYLQLSLRFANTKVGGFDRPMTLNVDREVFIVTNTKTLYFVQVEVPTLDGRSEAYSWVGQWLSSVRIPV